MATCRQVCRQVQYRMLWCSGLQVLTVVVAAVTAFMAPAPTCPRLGSTCYQGLQARAVAGPVLLGCCCTALLSMWGPAVAPSDQLPPEISKGCRGPTVVAACSEPMGYGRKLMVQEPRCMHCAGYTLLPKPAMNGAGRLPELHEGPQYGSGPPLLVSGWHQRPHSQCCCQTVSMFDRGTCKQEW